MPISTPPLVTFLLKQLYSDFNARPLDVVLAHNSDFATCDPCVDWVESKTEQLYWTHCEMLGKEWALYVDIGADLFETDISKTYVIVGMQLVIDILGSYNIAEELEITIQSPEGWNLFMTQYLQPALRRAKEWMEQQEGEYSEQDTDDENALDLSWGSPVEEDDNDTIELEDIPFRD